MTGPSSSLTRIEASVLGCFFSVVSAFSLLLSKRMCGCGHSIDSIFADRHAWKKGIVVERAVARVCREAGGHVATTMFVRNMDLGVPRAADSRRLEVVVDGSFFFGGVQLAVDPGEELQTVTEWPLQKQDE